MDVIIKNIKKKDFPVLKSLSKSLGFEIIIKEDKSSDSDKKNPEGKAKHGEDEKIKMIIKEIDEQWE